ncbi:SWIM zinc finger family protein [Brevibacillus daliensis]|uniref:SWIM zinc finger family protein n=1 Tax=Brevibacillus daliensis TaxID=2892995 RepID=UPI001E5847CB|nr:SWIM zinc finger family protein [Brevibacillus daliensis]
MNINNFSDHTNKTIFDRGYDYYMEGNIVEVNKHEDNLFTFVVQGSEKYEVVVKIDEAGKILYTNCECPYDFGPICKHQVAAFLELRDMLLHEVQCQTMIKVRSTQPEITEVLLNLSKEELISIIVDITQKDRVLEKKLLVRYSEIDGSNEIEKCKKWIDSIVRKYKGREGFISLGNAFSFANEMEKVLLNVRRTRDLFVSLELAFLVLEEAIEAFQYADDSNGDIGMIVNETLELIGETASIANNEKDIHIKHRVFNRLLEKSDSRIFDGWQDFQIELLNMCVQFTVSEVLRHTLIQKIEYLINQNSKNEYGRYGTERMLLILFTMISKYGTSEEAEEFLHVNWKYNAIREIAIDRYMEEKNYQKVIGVALEGEKLDSKYPGLVSKWKRLRYAAYKELSLKEEQEKLAKELLLEGYFEYYKELKGLVTNDENEFYANLKQELKKHKGWQIKSIFLKIIVEENDVDELMDFVTENPSSVEEYAGLLVVKYREKVIEVYKTHIRHVANQATNRKQYKEVGKKIKRYKKIAGKQYQEEIINELCELYVRRPAFIDELGKLK